MARLHLCLLLVALVAFSVRAQAIAPLAGLRPLAVVAPVFDSDAPSRGPLAAQHHADAAQGRRDSKPSVASEGASARRPEPAPQRHGGVESHSHDHAHAHAHAHKHHSTHGEHAEAVHTHGGKPCKSMMNRRLSDVDKQPFVAGVMTFVSGMAATLGGVIVVLIGRPSPRLLGCLLAFSSGVMLYISFADLMEHARKELGRVPEEDLAGLSAEDAAQRKSEAEGSAWLLSNLWMFAGMLLFAAVVHFIPEPDLVDGDASVEGHDHSVLLGPTAYADDGAVSDVDSAAVSGENGDEGGDEDEDGERGPLPSADVEAMREELFAMRVPELREEAAKVGLRSSAKSVRLKADLVERLLTIRLNPEGVPSEWLRAAAKGPATPGVEGPASGLRRRTRSSRRSGVARTPAPEPKIPSTTTTAAATTGSGNQPGFSEEDTRRLMLTGIITAVGISLHNLPEGLVVYTATISGMCDPEEAAAMTTTEYVSKCFGRGLSVALAIALHNIPEGMAVAVPIMGSTGSKWQALKWCLLSSLCEPAAAILFGYFFNDALTPQLLAVTNAAVAGIMIMLCLVELLPAALRVLSPLENALYNTLGMAFMFGSLHLLLESGAH